MKLIWQALRCLGHQHWIPRGRDRLIRLFANPDTMSFQPFRVPFFGHVYDGTLSTFIDWSVYFYGAYSRFELDLLADLCHLTGTERRPNMIDVGANVGHHTLFMAARCARIDAFEPFSPVMALLEARLAANSIRNCHAHPVGLADQEGEVAFVPPTGPNHGTGYFDLTPTALEMELEGVWHLPLVRGDDYLAAQEVPPTDILKIDVEGAEAAVLQGMARRVRRDRPAILMELSDRARGAFTGEDGFRAALYQNPVILSVHPVSISGTYRLEPFDFFRSAEVLILPIEMLARLESPLRERVSACFPDA